MTKFAEGHNDELDYISFIQAINSAKAYTSAGSKKKKMNVRHMGIQDPSQIPDFEKAKNQYLFEKKTRKGPSKSTQEALIPHMRTIRDLLASKASIREISAFLRDNFEVTISHTTIFRNLDFILKEMKNREI